MTARIRLVLAGLIVGVVAVLGVGAPAAAAPSTRLLISGVTVGPGSVRFLLTKSGPGSASPLVGSAVRVAVGDRRLDAEAAPSTDAVGLPQRQMIVVLDGSGAVSASNLARAKATAKALANALPPDVTLGLAVVSGRPTLAFPPSPDRAGFAAAVAAVVPSGPSRLVDTVNLACAALRSSASDDNRVVAITASADNGSAASAAQAGVSAASSGVLIDGVNLGTPGGAGPTALASLVSATGGTLTTAATATEAARAGRAEGDAVPNPLAVIAYVPTTLAGTNGTLTVSVAGTTLTATTSVLFLAMTGGPAVESALPLPAWTPYLVGVLIFLAVIVFMLAMTWPKAVRDDRMRQIDNFGPGRVAVPEAPKPAVEHGSPTSVIARTALAATASVVGSGQLAARIATRLERAGMRLRPAEWTLLRVCACVALAAVLFAFAGGLGALMGIALAWISTMLFQTIRIDRRMAKFAEQLPDALQLMIGSLRSGFSLPQALESLVRESPEPIAAEFGRANAEHRLGADVSDALERVAERTHSDDLEWAVMAVRIQREVGGNLAEVLQNTVDTMRERGRLRRHVSSLSAEGRISAFVLVGLPIILGLFMFVYRGAYMQPLINTAFGLTMLTGGGLLFVIGIFWMTRVIKVDA